MTWVGAFDDYTLFLAGALGICKITEAEENNGDPKVLESLNFHDSLFWYLVFFPFLSVLYSLTRTNEEELELISWSSILIEVEPIN